MIDQFHVAVAVFCIGLAAGSALTVVVLFLIQRVGELRGEFRSNKTLIEQRREAWRSAKPESPHVVRGRAQW